MTFVPFGEWLPDMPDFNNPGSSVITNVVPLTDQSYGPFATPSAYSTVGLDDRVRGAYSLTDAMGNVYNFAGDKAKLYLLQAGSVNYQDVSGTSAPYRLDDDILDFWDSTAFGDRVIFTNYVDPVQTYLVGNDTVFSDLSHDAPQARRCATIRDFLFLGNLYDGSGPHPRRVRWSAIGNPTSWPQVGSNAAIEVQSDEQDLEETDLGDVLDVIGGLLANADGCAFCERGIYRISYVGSPAIFDFTVAQGAVGCASHLSIVHCNGFAAYLGTDGFYLFDGGVAVPIGFNKIDKTFFGDVNQSYIPQVQGVQDPFNHQILWAYASKNSIGTYDRLLVYNWVLKRWSLIDLSGGHEIEYITKTTSIGYTLDELFTVLGYQTIDELPFSLDSRAWMGGQTLLSMFDPEHKLQFGMGATLPATLETTETQPFPGRRARITQARPLAEGDGGSIAIATRERLSQPPLYQAAVPVNAIGNCPQRLTGRYARARLTFPAGASFGHLQGVDVDARPEGRRDTGY